MEEAAWESIEYRRIWLAVRFWMNLRASFRRSSPSLPSAILRRQSSFCFLVSWASWSLALADSELRWLAMFFCSRVSTFSSAFWRLTSSRWSPEAKACICLSHSSAPSVPYIPIRTVGLMACMTARRASFSAELRFIPRSSRLERAYSLSLSWSCLFETPARDLDSETSTDCRPGIRPWARDASEETEAAGAEVMTLSPGATGWAGASDIGTTGSWPDRRARYAALATGSAGSSSERRPRLWRAPCK